MSVSSPLLLPSLSSLSSSSSSLPPSSLSPQTITFNNFSGIHFSTSVVLDDDDDDEDDKDDVTASVAVDAVDDDNDDDDDSDDGGIELELYEDNYYSDGEDIGWQEVGRHGDKRGNDVEGLKVDSTADETCTSPLLIITAEEWL